MRLFYILSMTFNVMMVNGRPWTSLEFAIPNSPSNLGQHCSNLGKRFCVIGVYIRPFLPNLTTKPLMPFDRTYFDTVLKSFYNRVNFFSFHEHEYGGCCDYQKDTYLHEGRFTGITVEEYALMLIDFKEGENMKKLNWIKAHFTPKVCLNIISQVGFGSGELMTAGNFSTAMGFAFPFKYKQDNLIFSMSQLHFGHLTFAWFKQQFVCPDQPWLCNDDTPQNIRQNVSYDFNTFFNPFGSQLRDY
ncbi:uncharacterized protein LOC142353531 [Convolutriloba macropyga]|uniref:uncharacterized protein LOC142353531 n=1 Tax=Convolutriloba macropyga TaxID=536237 RepID=UPI003F51F9A5